MSLLSYTVPILYNPQVLCTSQAKAAAVFADIAYVTVLSISHHGGVKSKRHTWASWECLSGEADDMVVGAWTVSYTHLDVYKRQA